MTAWGIFHARLADVQKTGTGDINAYDASHSALEKIFCCANLQYMVLNCAKPVPDAIWVRDGDLRQWWRTIREILFEFLVCL